MSTAANKPVSVIVNYHLKQGAEAQFLKLLSKHWPTLDKFGLVTKEKAKVWKATNVREPAKLTYVELMQWKDGSSADIAHQTPEVMQVWEAMGPILENLEIMNVEAIEF